MKAWASNFNYCVLPATSGRAGADRLDGKLGRIGRGVLAYTPAVGYRVDSAANARRPGHGSAGDSVSAAGRAGRTGSQPGSGDDCAGPGPGHRSECWGAHPTARCAARWAGLVVGRDKKLNRPQYRLWPRSGSKPLG
jgi:hypothetical protein